ncbi:MAG TPA: hypothetical protein PKA64_02900 [Myxococcota bacterium]|nr:hypothetical protein [Myxococcota bacterium]
MSTLLFLLAACTAPDDAAADCPTSLTDAQGACLGAMPDWDRGATFDAPRRDVYDLGDDLDAVRDRGLIYVSSWPVDVSGMLLPARPMREVFADDATNPDILGIQNLGRIALGFGTLDEMYTWLGLTTFNADGEGPFYTPPPPGQGPGDRMGVSFLDTPDGEAMTFSCATCHAARLFGRSVMGLHNRRARANAFFHLGRDFFPNIPPELFQGLTDADEGEMALFNRVAHNLRAVGSRPPQALGLDTSLAQVALSLSKREPDAWATRSDGFELAPRPNDLDAYVADSKPATWWTLKYKDRWLEDGSIVSGNPIFTNFLWNEIGRGTDLHELDRWLHQNLDVVSELTAAVFATEPVRWTDYFPASTLDLDAARRGEATFEARCAECHGRYAKDWDSDDPTLTRSVDYPSPTPVIDVGTDPQRALGMNAFADMLNDLEISAWMGTVVEPQTGYVPPPLDGIWARWPYLHNASIPTLCALLSPPEERPAVFWAGPSDDPDTDFDADCVGFPSEVPAAWMEEPSAQFDTSREGMSNAGHDAMLRDGDGGWLLDEAARADLIMFLKTL